MRRMTDLLIVGTGPAGLSAAIQGARDGLNITIIGDETPGGLVRAARRLDNLPGYPQGISGIKLAENLLAQIRKFGIEPQKAVVKVITKIDGSFKYETDIDFGLTRTVILATGTRPAAFHLPIDDNAKAGIYRDIRALPKNLSGKNIAVIGGGEAALDSALSCADKGGICVILARGAKIKAPESLLQEAIKAGIKILTGVQVDHIELKRKSILVRYHDFNEYNVIVDHLLICTGREPRTELYDLLCKNNRKPCTIRTKVSGLFLAGDVIHGNDRFTAIAMGDGQQAARMALSYIKNE